MRYEWCDLTEASIQAISEWIGEAASEKEPRWLHHEMLTLCGLWLIHPAGTFCFAGQLLMCSKCTVQQRPMEMEPDPPLGGAETLSL